MSIDEMGFFRRALGYSPSIPLCKSQDDERAGGAGDDGDEKDGANHGTISRRIHGCLQVQLKGTIFTVSRRAFPKSISPVNLR